MGYWGGELRGYEMFRSDKTGCRVGKSLIFSTGVNEIRDSWPKVNGMWDTQGPPSPSLLMEPQ